jgi:hypothetical protein
LKCHKSNWWESHYTGFDTSFTPLSTGPNDKDRRESKQRKQVGVAGGWIESLKQNSEKKFQLDMCYEDENNNSKNVGASGTVMEPSSIASGDGDGSGNSETVEALQTLSVVMGPLGEFTVDVYQDGFLVKSVDGDDIIEISGVGHGVIFVRNTEQGGKSNTVMDDGRGNVVSCNVSVLDAKTNEVLLNKYCAVAGFGPTKPFDWNENQQKTREVGSTPNPRSHHIKYPAVYPYEDNVQGCRPPGEDEKWSMSKWIGQITGTGANSDKNSPYEDKVAVVSRGDCMFEDKALIAQKAGASALIITNTEDNLFMMVGKQQVEEAAEAEAAAETKAEADSETTSKKHMYETDKQAESEQYTY